MLCFFFGKLVSTLRFDKSFGEAEKAGVSLALRLSAVALLLGIGTGRAVTTLLGQSLGAGKPQQVIRVVKMASLLDGIVMGLVSLMAVLFSTSIVGIFSADEAIISLSSSYLKILGTSYVLWSIANVFSKPFMEQLKCVPQCGLFFYGCG